MKWKFLGIIFIFILFFYTPIYNNSKNYKIENVTRLNNEKLINLSLLDNTDNTWSLLSLNEGYWGTTPLLMPFIAYTDEGLIGNYTNNGTEIVLFYKGLNMASLPQKSLYPKISFPFLIMSSSDRTYIEVYKLLGDSLQLIKQLYTKNIITSYASSPNGRFLAISTLSNDLLVLDSETKDYSITSIDLGFTKPVTYGIGINDTGLFYALGSFNPSYIHYGNINQTESLKQLEIPLKINAKSQSFSIIEDYFLIYTQHSTLMFKITDKSIHPITFKAKRPYSLTNALLLDKTHMALLYQLNTTEYILDIINLRTQTIAYKTHFFTQSIPKFISYDKKKSLIFKEGKIEL